MSAYRAAPGATLAAFQRAFAQALRGAGALDTAAQPGFAVHRNTVRGGCIDALEANYPVVAALVGRAWFRAAAAAYARHHPPTDVRLMLYGDGFAGFLAGRDRAAGRPWLPAVARLERLWREAHLAADAPALDAPGLQALPIGTLPQLRLAPHPAARWHWFDDAPALSVWRAHQSEDPAGPAAALRALDWRAEGVLVTRTQGAVRVAPASRATCAFLDACARRARLPEALAAAAAHAAPLDASDLLHGLLAAGALCAAPPAHPNPQRNPP